uniref:Uncharacterized protein n=1 Tax=Nelumbo nucifera TaxID=4432 RepID=A0A822YAM4_NELNU|nr:TPA_asm: hypothetical protein HUJ06_029807 [Nelumbo nucifera]
MVYRKSLFLQKVDDTLGVFHTHAVAELLGGVLRGYWRSRSFAGSSYRWGRRGTVTEAIGYSHQSC